MLIFSYVYPFKLGAQTKRALFLGKVTHSAGRSARLWEVCIFEITSQLNGITTTSLLHQITIQFNYFNGCTVLILFWVSVHATFRKVFF